MDCKNIKTYLDDFVLGELDPDIEIQVNEHLATCQACKAELGKYEKIRQYLQCENKIEPLPHVYEKIRSKAILPSRNREHSWFFPKTLVFAIGAFVLGIVVMRSIDLHMLRRSSEIETGIEHKPSVKEYYTDSVQFYTVPPENLVRL